MRSQFRTLVFCISAICASGPAAAQDVADYPNRPIHIVVPFAAGGASDVATRILAQKLSQELGTSVVVENRPGGETAIGAVAVANAPPDGYTLLSAMDSTLVLNPITKSKLAYDPFKDFVPITLTAKNAPLLTVRADGPKTVRELIEKAKANPGKLNFGTSLLTFRLAAHLFFKGAGMDAVLIPFKGGTEGVQALLQGSVDFTFDATTPNLPLIQSGQLRALAKLNNRFMASLPDLQSLAVTADLPSFGDVSVWTGLVAPAGTPRPIIEKVRQAVLRSYADPVVQEKLSKAAILPETSTSEEFAAFIRSEFERWSNVYKETGIKIE